MASSNAPAKGPERQPEPAPSAPRPSWPAPERKPSRFPIRIQGGIPN